MGLRCKLVHEFGTHGPGGRVYLSSSGKPAFKNDAAGDFLLLDPAHFCAAVRTAFETFFTTATDTEQRKFVNLAYIDVIPVARGPVVVALPDELLVAPIEVSTNKFPASGSSGPPPSDMSGFDFDDV